MDLKCILSSILFVIYLRYANSNIFVSSISSSSACLTKCTLTCEKTFPLTSNKIARSECCSRGCRFYGIAELVGSSKQIELNTSRDACHNCCLESYTEDSDQSACNMGCDTMAKDQLEMLKHASAEVSWAFFIEDGEGQQILQAGELSEPDDVLTDPGLKKQLILDLMDNNKLPEMRVKTLPVNSDGPEPGPVEWWTDCDIKQDGVPRCLVASLVMMLIMLALWFLINCDEKAMQPSLPIVYDPEQAPELPPKYSLLEDVKV